MFIYSKCMYIYVCVCVLGQRYVGEKKSLCCLFCYTEELEPLRINDMASGTVILSVVCCPN